MTSAPNTTPPSLQGYRLLVYRSVLHPEFFKILDRQTLAGKDYELESWIAHGTHMMRFQCDDYCVVEVVTPCARGFPDAGRLTSLPCAGERDHTQPVGDRIRYTTTVQTEILSANLFKVYAEEMTTHAEKTGGLMTRWSAPKTTTESVSIVCLQRLRNEVHAQAWHLDATCGLVVRSQAIFEVMRSPHSLN